MAYMYMQKIYSKHLHQDFTAESQLTAARTVSRELKQDGPLRLRCRQEKKGEDRADKEGGIIITIIRAPALGTGKPKSFSRTIL